MVTRKSPGNCHTRTAAIACLEKRHLAAEWISVLVFPFLVDRMVIRRANAGDLGEVSVRDTRVETVGVRGLVLRRQTDAPSLV